ncbi:ATP synthase F1 subunit epsilon [Pelagibacteraceae bacterium]|jgi:ATP synthase F1 epsilon subunit|nr:ATP synthase F1 subunit epsilon [Pelagibacteraceae bacterium]MDB9743000.1 ATP synthase F1 subunit epsilon [Pelagibacteraceae bacterium]MDC0339510.1 ATP synthase F1 subunit epsilon [Pelagibacteraceae bacterium]MDC0366122.1 ATP synthase F1 subunit epsilon [Pelagibacteraceae bacterium]|tara:strand:- start:374 stop:766 length:393 start_codon:yes stop_codon:yes gene_type:complete
MSENFTIEIIRPDKSILNSETTEVTIPSYEGEMGILKDHIPLITFLRPGLIIVKNNSDEKLFFTEDGIVEFANNNLLILSSTTKNLNSLEKNFIDTMIKNSQDKFNSDEINDKEKYLLSYKIETLKQINQ